MRRHRPHLRRHGSTRSSWRRSPRPSRAERPIALEISDHRRGDRREAARRPDDDDGEPEQARELLARGETGILDTPARAQIFVSSFAPRPEHVRLRRHRPRGGAWPRSAASSATASPCATPARSSSHRSASRTSTSSSSSGPTASSPRRPSTSAPSICVLTHDHKFDVPILKVALESPAGYIGAMGARRTNAAPRRAPPRRGRHRRGARPHPRADRPEDRLAHARRRWRSRSPPRSSRSCARPSRAVRQEVVASEARELVRGRRVAGEGLGPAHGRPAHRPVHARGEAGRGRSTRTTGRRRCR